MELATVAAADAGVVAGCSLRSSWADEKEEKGRDDSRPFSSFSCSGI